MIQRWLIGGVVLVSVLGTSCGGGDKDLKDGSEQDSDDGVYDATFEVRIIKNGDDEEPKLRKVIEKEEKPILVAPLVKSVEWSLRIESKEGDEVKARLVKDGDRKYSPWKKENQNTFKAKVGGAKISSDLVPHKGVFVFEAMSVDECKSKKVSKSCDDERIFVPVITRKVEVAYWFYPDDEVGCIIANAADEVNKTQDDSTKKKRAIRSLWDSIVNLSRTLQGCDGDEDDS